MAQLIPNDFSSYELTPEELLQGSLLTITQKQVIHTRISILATEKLNLDYNPSDPDSFLQNEAKLKGQLEELRYLLEASEASEEEIRFRTTTDSNE